MSHSITLRIARPTDDLAALAEMYANGLGFSLLAEFTDHAGFDGCVLGSPNAAYHIEFTQQRGAVAGRAPSKDHLLVFYIADPSEWERRCARMITAGFRDVPSHSPYWDIGGRTFEDLDGYRVVLQNGRWNP